MKYIKYFKENVSISKKLIFGERYAAVSSKFRKRKIESKVLYALYNGEEIANINYYIFDNPYTKEFNGIYKKEMYITDVDIYIKHQQLNIITSLFNKLIKKAKELNIDIITLDNDMCMESPKWLDFRKIGFIDYYNTYTYLPLN